MEIERSDALWLVKEFCARDFEGRDVQGACALLSRDIAWFGSGAGEDIRGLSAARTYLQREIAGHPRPYRVQYESEACFPLGERESTALVKLKLTAEDLVMECRLTATTTTEDGVSKLGTLHLSVPAALQGQGESAPTALPQVLERELWTSLLNETISGGMMGGYVEPGFPFYFISARMLTYLGYSSQEEFVADIGGLIINSMHPEDAAGVEETVARGLAAEGAYSVEYRVRKKDGSYLWVQDYGKQSTAADGRCVILSVLYDITAQKQAAIQLEDTARQMQQIIDAIPGGVAAYQTVGGVIKTLHYSQELPAMIGYSNEEFAAHIRDNAMEIVCQEDRPMLEAAIAKAVEQGSILRLSFRVRHRDGGLVGVHMNAKAIGQSEGRPVWYAVYMRMSDESRLYREIANESTNGIYVISKAERRLLYMNRQMGAALELAGTQLHLGELCHCVLRQRETPCPDCPVFFQEDEGKPREVYISSLEKYFSVVARSVLWEGVPAYVVYISDISQEKRASREIARIYNNIPGAVFSCRFDETWQVLSANDGLFKFLGYTREEFAALGSCMSAVIYPEDLNAIETVASAQLDHGAATIESELRLVCKGGDIKWISMKAQLLVRDTGEQFLYCMFVDITRQKQEQAGRLSTEKNLAIAMDHANMYYWEYEFATGVAYVSEAVQRMFGVPAVLADYPESYLALGFVAQEDVPKYRKGVARLAEGEPYVEFDARVRTLQHGYVWMRLRFTGISDQSGKTTRAVCTSEEIAEYKDLESRFTTVMEQNGIATWLYDMSRHAILQNYNTKAIYGVDAEEIQDVPESLIAAKRCHPEDVEKIRAFYRELYRGAKQQTAVLRFWNEKKKSFLWKRCTYTLIPDRKGLFTYALGSAVDISEQVEAKKKYDSAIRYRYRTLGENVLLAGHSNVTRNQVLEMTDKTGKALLQRFGSQRDAFFQGLGTLIPDADQRQAFYHMVLNERIETNFRLGITQRELTCEMSLDAGGRNLRWVHACIDVVEEPETKELIGFLSLSDITKNKLQEQVLDSVARFDYDYVAHVNLHTDTLTIYRSKEDGYTLHYSYGVPYSFREAVKSVAEKLVVPEERALYLQKMNQKAIEQALRTKDDDAFTFHMQGKDGNVRVKRARVMMQDRQAGIVIISRNDVTDMIAQQEEQRAALLESLTIAERANRSKSDFLSAMSHDIRTPMNAIVGMTELAVSNENDAEQVHESLQIIQRSSTLLLSIINDILDMSRVESGKMVLANETFSIGEQWQLQIDGARALAAAKKQRLNAYADIHHTRCTGDVVRIHRALDNILSNALKFTPPGGTITYRISELPMENQKLALYRFEISDTGIGISPAEQAHIFEPFYRVESSLTSQVEGTGLGLAIAKSMVDYMGGTLTVHSTPGVGTTFVVELPLRLAAEEEPQPAPQVDSPEGKVDLTGVHVLLCEDHPVNRKVARRILEKAGAVVTAEENGQRGYERFTQSRTGEFDVILMDIQMPVMNGYEATRSIRESGHPQARSIPILAMTANAFAEDIQKSLAAGMNEHLAKPIDPARLYAALRRYVPQKKIGRPAKRKVLFVDDVELNIVVLTAAISGEYQVLVARSGEEALRILRENPDIAAMITDIVMPGMDGVTLIRTLRADQQFQNLAILANTQYGDPTQEETLLRVGADDFLYKPTTPIIVRNRLKSVLRKYGSV